jgi:hypothetical protein
VVVAGQPDGHLTRAFAVQVAARHHLSGRGGTIAQVLRKAMTPKKRL